MIDQIERPEVKPMARWMGLLFYGIDCALGVVVCGAILWRYGISKPASLLVWSTMLVLSLMWFRDALRSVPVTSRRFGFQNMVLAMLVVASTWVKELHW
jgi:hypothetical protein